MGTPHSNTASIPSIDGPKPWTHTRFPHEPRHFQFAIVADRSGGVRQGVFTKAVRRLNLLQPEFVISVGDFIEGMTEDVATANAQWDEFDALVQQLDMPFFYVPGNHDISNNTMADIWRRRYGRLFYHFVYQGVLFLCLCSEDPPEDQISDEQVEYVRRALDDNSDVRWTFAFIHKPFWQYDETTQRESNWLQVEEMLKTRKHTVFVGHEHAYVESERCGMRYVTLASTGGFTAPDTPGKMEHITWVTMLDDGPRVANILVDGVVGSTGLTEAMLRIRRANPVNIEPVLVSESVFREGHARISIHNTTGHTFNCWGRFKEPSLLGIEPHTFQTAVPPDSIRDVELAISASEPVEVDELPEVLLDWNLSVAPVDDDPVDVTGTSRLNIERAVALEGEFQDDFSAYAQDSDGSPVWRPMDGLWVVRGGEYHHLHTEGYDYCSAADAWVSGDHKIQMRVRLVEGILEAGILFNLPSRFGRRCCEMVRFNGAETLWFGHFDTFGVFSLDDSTTTGLPTDHSDWATLEINVRNSQGAFDVAVGGRRVAEGVKERSVSVNDSLRCMALVSCRGHVAYDHVSVSPRGK